MPKRAGRKSKAQTPAPRKERIYGSKKNPKGSAASEKSASKIKLDEKTMTALKNKLKEFKEKHPNKKNITLNDLKAVYRRGAGAYSKSHRPTITGGAPNTRNAWSMARVNKFLLKAGGTKVKAAYVQDDDLMKMAKGGEILGIKYTISKGESDDERIVTFEEGQYRDIQIEPHDAIFHKTWGRMGGEGWAHIKEFGFTYPTIREAIKSYLEDKRGKKYPIVTKKKGGITLLAPNGKPSNLNSEQWHLVRTPEFKAWFGDWENDPQNASKVVDENGEPMVVYHGTNEKFTKFSKSFSRGKKKQLGIYLSNNPEVAKLYGDKILECFVSIKDPFIKNYEGENYWNLYGSSDLEVSAQFNRAKAKITNVDGVIFLNIKDSLERFTNAEIGNNYIPFNPNQIKLADGSNTTFDSDSDDIRYEEGGEIKLYEYKDEDEHKITFDFVSNNRGVGKLILTNDPLYDLGFDNVLEIRLLYVDKDYRGEGIAKQLIKSAIKWAKDNNVDWLISLIHVRSDSSLTNKQMVGFLKRYGFEYIDTKYNSDILGLRIKEVYDKGGFIAPNGKPTNLTAEQYKLVRTPQFKAWFGDWENDPQNASKVVDDNGEPLVVYHGSDYVFNVFKTDKQIYFATNKEYASEISESGRVKSFFINIRNLLDATKFYIDDYSHREYKTFLKKNGIDVKIISRDNEIVSKFWYLISNSSIWKSIKEKYDGFSMYENMFATKGKIEEEDFDDPFTKVYVCFESNQIKLADGSNTTFDGSNPDVRYAKGGLIAPNGKPSNLTPEQYKLVRTPQFKAWFGDWENDLENASKVVDENGEPLVVYHGTSASFNTFKEQEKGKRGGLNEKFWSFTTNIEQALIYALDTRVYGRFAEPRIISAFLNIKYMPSYDNKGKFYRELEVWGGYKYIDIFQLQDWHSRGFNMGVEFKEVDGFEVKNTIEMEIRDDVDKYKLIGNTYYVKNSNQIKLADGTNTTFDSDSDDIRYAKGGMVKDFDKTFIDSLSNDIIYHTDAMEQGAWMDYDEPESVSIKNVKKFINKIFNTEWNNAGLKNIPETFKLYRVVFLKDEKELKTDFLGYHWVRDEKLVKTHITDMMGQFNVFPTHKNMQYMIIADFKKDDIDIYWTVYNNVSVDHEEEVTIKKDAKPINYKLVKFYAKGGDVDEVITCKNCGWSWNESQTTPSEKYICHKCGFDNEPNDGYAKGGQTFNDKELLAKWKRGESIGFTATAHLKAKGLIPRSDGEKRKSPQYKRKGGLIGGFEDLEDEWLSKKIEIFLDKVKPIKFYFVDPNTNTITVGFDKYYSQDAAQKVYEEATSSKEFFHAPSVESTYDSKTGDLVFKIKLKKPVEYGQGGEVDEKVIRERWAKKKDSLMNMADNIRSLRTNLRKDLKGDDDKDRLTALAISLMDKTAERVGNDESESNGHLGITGLSKRNVKVEGNTITLKYIGKSGVKHEKQFSDEGIATALKDAIANSQSKYVFETSDGFRIKNDRINRYLNEYDISAKDLRGYSANQWIVSKLREVKDKEILGDEAKRKKKFNEIVKSVAEKVGHGAPTLKKHYMLPSLEREWVNNGKIVDLANIKRAFEDGGVINYARGGSPRIRMSEANEIKEYIKKQHEQGKSASWSNNNFQYVARPDGRLLSYDSSNGKYKFYEDVDSFIRALYRFQNRGYKRGGDIGVGNINVGTGVVNNIDYDHLDESQDIPNDGEGVFDKGGELKRLSPGYYKGTYKGVDFTISRQGELPSGDKPMWYFQINNGAVNDLFYTLQQTLEAVKYIIDNPSEFVDGGEIDFVEAKRLYSIAYGGYDGERLSQSQKRSQSMKSHYAQRKLKKLIGFDIGDLPSHTNEQKKIREQILNYSEMKKGGELKFNDVVLFHEEQGNWLVPKNTIYAWLYDDPKASEKIESGEYDYILFPPGGGIGLFSQKGYVPPLLKVWTKKYQAQKKGANKLIGIVRGWYDEDNKKLYIDMMTTRKDMRRKGVNSYIIKEIREYFGLEKEQVEFVDTTKEGKMFAKSDKYSKGGGVDLFEHQDKLPPKVRAILEKYESEEPEYSTLESLQGELEEEGYTFDYGLDYTPYGLRKMEKGGELVSYPKRIVEFFDRENKKWIREPFTIKKGQLIIYNHSDGGDVEAKFLGKSGDKAKIEILDSYSPWTRRVEIRGYVNPAGRTEPDYYLNEVPRGTKKTVSVNLIEIADDKYYSYWQKPISRWLRSPEFKEAFGHLDNPTTMAKGGEISDEEKKETYKKWKSLVNMSKSELEKFYNSEEGKVAGLTASQAKSQGIDSGRESARWIMKMKDTSVKNWTPTMWKWAKKQISFISRMSGNKGKLYDESGAKTRKHTSLLIWGHNPTKKAGGGELDIPIKENAMNEVTYNQLPAINDLGVGKKFVLKEHYYNNHNGKPTHQGCRYLIVENMGDAQMSDCLKLKVHHCYGGGGVTTMGIITRPIKNIMNKGRDMGESLASGVEKAFKKGGELDPDKKEVKQYFEHKSGAAGGLLVGKRHSEGGIQAINKSTGQPLEMEGGEVVITRDAVSDSTLHDFNGKQMTNREILSAINESGGGVKFAEGGDVSCLCSGKEYKLGGKTYKDYELFKKINNSYGSKSAIEKGMKVEDKEHGETFRMLKNGEITYEQFLKKLVVDHLSENPKYYDK